MNSSDFDYNLPTERIAQNSIEPRDHSRLMILDKVKKTTEDKHFYDIVQYLRAGDLLVWNNSKVFKARLLGKLLTQNNEGLWEHKRDVEIFLLRPMENDGVWQVLGKPGKHIKAGTRVEIAKDFFCDVMLKEKEGIILVQFFGGERRTLSEEQIRESANHYGHIPIPPYVKDEPHEIESYQTVYSKHEGSVAAPTAGFHFTQELIETLKNTGVEFAEVTLHVGLGTFLPVKTERIEDHTMHSEWVELTQENAEKINQAKAEGRRVVAVGTTTVRTLEGISLLDQDHGRNHFIHPYRGEINMFIKPGFEFKIVDALITNFHLPKSTLLMLVSAFVGDQEFMMGCYKKAVEEKYRFFSFGDAMFVF
ncbi:MAG: tRNA preQ1(34) S-adenosylmethionine ribosyltransferase-isomerase QueA [Candidatus Magasanikbacteria bacterium RIFCSPHIGHO2_02_FULL_41_13]|uniref:S-adenosylmethionine:tRNA ribosyltransferase-isomerase n=1 Tax=Candidatus Magasanikbacteria bacterium RIFCSPHIGHO2_02_FULL_41_13 TaxID=1798676 RepID=A0A1F6M2M5_9BACT|nr:MAG: tRNA preQ1(34) S-adenosylmethionine ribosyltransferase-isomerase QueA [Candidatus Magasanikbacteria bacterium RIFCSPHIGHO2_02_FULL_41_13]